MIFVEAPHGIGVVERREVHSATTVLVCSGLECATDAGRKRDSFEEGVEVRVFNKLGEVRCIATINHSLRPGVVCIPKGTWDHNTLSGNTANVLVPDTLTDIAGGACFNDARVQIATTE